MKISLQIAHHDLASNFPRPLFKILDWPNNRDTKKIESFSLSTYGAAPVAQANRRRYAHVSKGDSIGRTLSIRNWSLIDHDVYRLCNASRTRLVVEGGMGETRIVLRGNQATQQMAAVRELVCLGVKKTGYETCQSTPGEDSDECARFFSNRAWKPAVISQSGSVGFEN